MQKNFVQITGDVSKEALEYGDKFTLEDVTPCDVILTFYSLFTRKEVIIDVIDVPKSPIDCLIVYRLMKANGKCLDFEIFA